MMLSADFIEFLKSCTDMQLVGLQNDARKYDKETLDAVLMEMRRRAKEEVVLTIPHLRVMRSLKRHEKCWPVIDCLLETFKKVGSLNEKIDFLENQNADLAKACEELREKVNKWEKENESKAGAQ